LLKQIGASVSVDGVCLSVTIDDDLIAFDAINVTLRTNLGDRLMW
jgi:riboflavin synthase alpha subunit